MGKNLMKKCSKEWDNTNENIEDFKCDYCSVSSTKKVTLNKHMNTRNEEKYCHETDSTFILCLGLEELAQEYKDYFKRYGFTREEAQHVENMVQK